MNGMAWVCLWGGMLLLYCAGCTGRTGRDPQTLAYTQIIDLSHAVSADMPQVPVAPQTRLIGADGGVALELSLPDTTYLRVPVEANSFRSTEHLSPRELIVPAVVLDVRHEVQRTPTYLLTVDAIRAWEWQHGRIPAGSMVLLATGWDAYWEQPEAYLQLDTNQQPQVPGFSAAAAAFLLDKRSVKGLGSDTPSIDGRDHTQQASAQVLLAEGLILENVTGLAHMPPEGATLFIGILKVQSGSGSPATVLAFVP